MFDFKEYFVRFFITLAILTVVFIFFLIAALVRLRNNQNKKKRKLLSDMIAERERTMYSISTEIHDNVNQELHLARMTLKVVERTMEGRAATYLPEVGKMLDNVINQLRNIGHSLNSDYVKKKGIYNFLETEVARINITQKLQCHIESKGIAKPFNQETELIVIRIAQEIIQNSLKHSKAKNLIISLTYDDHQFEMCIKDDGIGFQTNEKTEGIGIQSLYNRTKLISGRLNIQSDNTGTDIQLVIPEPKYRR